jgi:hypothetical protein
VAGLMLTAVLSASSTRPNGIALRGIRFALYLSTYKIGFPGWPELILDSVTGFGASITKRGLAPAPFFIFQPESLFPSNSTFAQRVHVRFKACVVSAGSLVGERLTVRKKMSGRWGERPLGRGMEGTVIRSQFRRSGRSAALASSKTTHRSKQVTTVVILQKAQTTSDYSRSVPSAEFHVDSSAGSFSPVLNSASRAPFLVP